MNAENRSSNNDTGEDHVSRGQAGPGVGGRQADWVGHPEGGEYQNSCKKIENLAPRNGEISYTDLKSMGLPPVWLMIAKRIGVDAFLDVWELLDSTANESRTVRIPLTSSIDRHFRNKLITSLRNEGLTASEIVRYLNKNLDIKITPMTVCRSYEKSRNLS